jgi:integrase
LANRIDRERARGVDVVEQRKADKHRAKAAAVDRASNTFGAALHEFFIDHKVRKWRTRPRDWRRHARLLGLNWPFDCDDPAKLQPEVIPGSLAATWGERPLAEIDAHDIHTMVDDARRRGFPGLRRRIDGTSDARGRKLHAVLSSFFRWAQQQRRVLTNPCAGVWKPGPAPARERVLNDSEIVMFWHACEQIASPYGALFKLMLLTGTRVKEAAGLRRSELSEDGTSWTIPSARSKNHLAHAVPLPPLARSIIAAQPIIAPGDLVFTNNGRRSVSSFSRHKAELLTNLPGVPYFSLHDLRRSCASGLQRLKVRVEVVERALNHVSGVYRSVAGVYQRDPLTEEVRDGLERWARRIEGLVAPTEKKVVPWPK